MNVSIYSKRLENLKKQDFSKMKKKKMISNRCLVPNYKTVSLKTPKTHRSKREVRPVEFEVGGKKTQLNLTPLTYESVLRNTPVWTVETDNEKSSKHTYLKLDQVRNRMFLLKPVIYK